MSIELVIPVEAPGADENNQESVLLHAPKIAQPANVYFGLDNVIAASTTWGRRWDRKARKIPLVSKIQGSGTWPVNREIDRVKAINVNYLWGDRTRPVRYIKRTPQSTSVQLCEGSYIGGLKQNVVYRDIVRQNRNEPYVEYYQPIPTQQVPPGFTVDTPVNTQGARNF